MVEKMNRASLKGNAKQILSNNKMLLVAGVVVALFSVLSMATVDIAILSLVVQLGMIAMSFIMTMLILEVVCHGRKMDFNSINDLSCLEPVKSYLNGAKIWRFIKTELLVLLMVLPASLIIGFGSFCMVTGTVSLIFSSSVFTKVLYAIGLLGTIGGAILYFCVVLNYSFAIYIAMDGMHEELSCRECLEESKKMLKGRKKDLLVLMLSFFPWLLLVGFTYGIASFFVIPYISVTTITWYKEISEQFSGKAVNFN